MLTKPCPQSSGLTNGGQSSIDGNSRDANRLAKHLGDFGKTFPLPAALTPPDAKLRDSD